jgi:uncharacterized Zn finger protein
MHAPWDGNAAAGDLTEVFVPEMTVATTTCASCGAVAHLGELSTYLRAPGTVLRCASCGAVQIRLVRTSERLWLDMRGVQALQMDLNPGMSR